MKNIKDRKIRKSNLPKDVTIYKVKSRFRHKLYVMLFFAGVLMFLKTNAILIIISLVLFYVILSASDKVIFEVREHFLVNYLSEEFVEIIYYDEIINYRFDKLEYRDVKLIVFTKDEQEYTFVLPDFKVVAQLDKLIGDKKVGK